MKEEDILFLNKIIASLKEVYPKLEEFYNKKDFDSFNRSKKLILMLQEKISEILR